MKKITLLSILCLFVVFANAQEEYNDKQNMEVKTTREAHFPDGEKALYEHVFKNIKYTEEDKAAYLEGNVTISFNVQPDSSVTSTFVISGVNPAIDGEVKRILKELKFAPSIRNGLKVRMNLVYTFPIAAH